jgi:hypothetical protein
VRLEEKRIELVMAASIDFMRTSGVTRVATCLLTRRPGPHYTARPGSRVPMFTSRCITPRACASAHPDPSNASGDHR